MTVHDFTESLERSHRYADAPWWREVYEQAFHNLTEMTDVRADGWAQRAGIDRRLNMSDGTTVTVDEKVRDEDYGDIALERWSDQARRSLGWAQKDLMCDYVAYAVAPTRTCYLLPFKTLRAAVRCHGNDWRERAYHGLDGRALEPRPGGCRHRGRDGFWVILADNGTYQTESICVPVDVLLNAVRDRMVIQWVSA